MGGLRRLAAAMFAFTPMSIGLVDVVRQPEVLLVDARHYHDYERAVNQALSKR